MVISKLQNTMQTTTKHKVTMHRVTLKDILFHDQKVKVQDKYSMTQVGKKFCLHIYIYIYVNQCTENNEKGYSQKCSQVLSLSRGMERGSVQGKKAFIFHIFHSTYALLVFSYDDSLFAYYIIKHTHMRYDKYNYCCMVLVVVLSCSVVSDSL